MRKSLEVPITVAIGELETGKSTMIRTDLLLFGYHQISIYMIQMHYSWKGLASQLFLFGIEEAMPIKVNKFDLKELAIDGAILTNMKTDALKPKPVKF